MYTVALTNPIAEPALALLREHAQVRLAASPTPADILRAAEGSDAIIVRAQLPDGIFARCRTLRAAVRHGTGVDFIPLEEATAHGVVVANVPGVNAGSVAEHATLLMLGLARGGFAVAQMLQRDGWDAARHHAAQAREVQGCTVGIVGFGNVGRRIAALWHAAFGAHVLAYSPSGTALPPWAQAAPLAALARASDFVVLCCPLTPQTRGMVDAEFLAAMRPGAFLVNVARGGVVDEAALLQALRSGAIAGAALDVYPAHPLPAESPLLRMPNVICTPHCAGISATSLEAMGRGAVQEVLRVLDGGEPLHPVNTVPTDRRRAATPEVNP
jgi:D-3-phosphoglycerate dehydrogenase / 2-oxoglutarate reductase